MARNSSYIMLYSYKSAPLPFKIYINHLELVKSGKGHCIQELKVKSQSLFVQSAEPQVSANGKLSMGIGVFSIIYDIICI